MRTRRCAALLGVVMLAVAPAGASAAAREVVVMTSFPKELFEEYKKAFERHHPGGTVAVKQRQTNEGGAYLRETRGPTRRGVGAAELRNGAYGMKSTAANGPPERIGFPASGPVRCIRAPHIGQVAVWRWAVYVQP